MASYRGRFAPTPSGPLHWGSLLTALVSYLDARAHSGRWSLRIDDLDTARVRPGAADAIMRCLEAHGLHWDGEVHYQSASLDRYQSALEALEHEGWLYACTCSRKAVAGKRYPGTCRDQQRPTPGAALRIRSPSNAVVFVDRFAGPQRFDLAATSGDYILKRRDGIIAYQLAAAVDDATPAITQVVRGRDLLDSTPRQLHVMASLKLEPPGYAHLPVVIDTFGVKLSKHLDDAPITNRTTGENLHRLLTWLDLKPQAANDRLPPVEEQLQHAVRVWRTHYQRSTSAPEPLRQKDLHLSDLLGAPGKR